MEISEIPKFPYSISKFQIPKFCTLAHAVKIQRHKSHLYENNTGSYNLTKVEVPWL